MIIDFSNNSQEEPNLDTMTREELGDYLHVLEEKLAQLDAKEPRKPNSEAYEDWADAHEDLEDAIDEVLDLLDEMDD